MCVCVCVCVFVFVVLHLWVFACMCMWVHSVQLTVTWTSVPTATSYNVSSNESINTLVPIPSIKASQYTFTGLTKNTVYTVSVVAINCAGSSSALTSFRTGKYAKVGYFIISNFNNLISCLCRVLFKPIYHGNTISSLSVLF